MWFVMEKAQNSFNVQARLIHTINQCSGTFGIDLEGRNPERIRESIEDLIGCGADVNSFHGNFLPLHCACMAGNVVAVSVLLEYGVDVNAYDGFNRNALHYAAERSLELVRTLVAHGADIDKRDQTGHTPLHWAAYVNRFEIVRFLLEQGANPNVRDDNHETPLGFAAYKGNLESLKILLEYDALIDTRNRNNASPLDRLLGTLAIGIGSTKEELCLNLMLKALGQIAVPNGLLFGTGLDLDPNISDLLFPYSKSPRTLQELCRFRIRSALSPCHMPTVSALLPLPAKLRNYVTLEL